MNLNFDDEKKSNPSIKIAFGIIISVLIIGGLGYFYKKYLDAKALQTQLVIAKSQKLVIINDLNHLKATYDTIISGKSTISDSLITERTKVVNLINDLKNAKIDSVSIAKYKQQFVDLETKMKELTVIIKNDKPVVLQIDSTTTILEEPKIVVEPLIEKKSSITIQDLNTFTFKAKSYDNQEADNSSADMIKINFTIVQNQIEKSGDKQYYIQILNTKNNVLGYQKTESFGDNVLTYSFLETIKNSRKTVRVSEDLPSKDFRKGTYYVGVFDQDVLVFKTSFKIK